MNGLTIEANMVDLGKLAMSLASGGSIVDVDVETWDGVIPSSSGLCEIDIRVVPESITGSFCESARNIKRNLLDHSIQCSEGRFVTDRALASWNKKHLEECAVFSSIKLSLLSVLEEIRNSSRSAVSSVATDEWRAKHPSDPIPPPSLISYAANMASSMIPSKDALYEKCHVARRVNSHSFIFSNNDKACFLDEGEKRLLAWKTIDELVAGNARFLSSRMSFVVAHTMNKGRRIEIAKYGVRSFLMTDLLPQLGLTEIAKELWEYVDGKMAVDADWQKLEFMADSVRAAADSVSTVSSILGKMK